MNSINAMQPVATVSVEVRAAFITRTYLHLIGAILGFTMVEVYLFNSGLAETITRTLLGTSWLLSIGGFMIVAWLASHTAYKAKSLGAQYAVLAAFVVVEAIVFTPLLFIANYKFPGVIQSAALVTMLGFSALTAVVFYTRKNFSFVGSLLRWSGIVALLLIVAGVLFGFRLGTFFSVTMIAFAGGAILYDTSNVLHNFPEDRHVAASLELFASAALLFWYVLRLFTSAKD